MNVAIVGTGRWAMVIYSKLKERDYISKIFFVGRGKKIGTTVNDEQCISIADLKKEKIDSAFVIVPVSEMYQVAMTCLLNDVNVFVEKPGAHNLESLLMLTKLSKDKRLKFQVGYQYLFESESALLKHELEQETATIEIDHLWVKRKRSESSIVDNLLSHEIARLSFATNGDLRLLMANISKNKDLLEGRLTFEHKKDKILFNFHINQDSNFITVKHTRYEGFDLDWMTKSFGNSVADLINTEIDFFFGWDAAKIEQFQGECIIETRHILDTIKNVI